MHKRANWLSFACASREEMQNPLSAALGRLKRLLLSEKIAAKC
jgi:hypothetical protein